MNNEYTIADLHFSHRSMAERRGFDSIEQHDNHIVTKWNSVVRKTDTVWILGDITMEKRTPYPILEKLNGIKKVILGNHDKPEHVVDLMQYVKCVSGLYKHNGFILSHAPIHECEIMNFYGNIHGHVHDKTLPDERYINVSCEAVDFTPQLLKKLQKKLLEKKYGFE